MMIGLAFVGAGGAGGAILLMFLAVWLVALFFGAAFCFAFVKKYNTRLPKWRKVAALVCSGLGTLWVITLLVLWWRAQ